MTTPRTLAPQGAQSFAEPSWLDGKGGRSLSYDPAFPTEALHAHITRHVAESLACTPNDRENLRLLQEALGAQVVFPNPDGSAPPAYQLHRRLTLDDVRAVAPIAQALVGARDALTAVTDHQTRALDNVRRAVDEALDAVAALRSAADGGSVGGEV